jgi:hypothetical protein
VTDHRGDRNREHIQKSMMNLCAVARISLHALELVGQISKSDWVIDETIDIAPAAGLIDGL